MASRTALMGGTRPRRRGCDDLALPASRAGACRRRARSSAKNRRRIHAADSPEPAGSADHHRARRSSAGVRYGAVAAQVSRPRRRHAGRAHVREGHLPLLRGAREGLADAREVLEDRHHRRRARHRRPRHRRRSDDRLARSLSADARRADRSAADDGCAGRGADRDREAGLLHHERHALAGNRRPRDADRAGVPADRRRDAVHPEHPQQRHHAHHARDRSGRPREAGGHVLLQQEARAGRRAAAAHVLGQVRPARQQPP